ncbi:MAG: virulence factor [Proteobacteria bacterium]|nr:virulence factor [Pseudomonadota bacterium]
MADMIVVYWRDIPAQVIVRAGRSTAKRQLSTRFQEAIDLAAMRAGAIGTDAYLNDWRRSEPTPCGDDLEAEADAAQARIEREFDDAQIAGLVKGYGHDKAAD